MVELGKPGREGSGQWVADRERGRWAADRERAGGGWQGEGGRQVSGQCTFNSNSYTEYESRAPRTITRSVSNSVFGTCVISLIQIHNPNSDVFQV